MIRRITIATILLLSASFLFSCSNGSFPLTGDGDPDANIDFLNEESFNKKVHEQPEVSDPAILTLPRAGIYAGKGSWDVNVRALERFLDEYDYNWSVFDENDAVKDSLSKNYDLIWFPGGLSAEYKYYITDHENIRSFVENGGIFVGSCAGSYYAVDILRWLGSDYNYPLKIFDGKAVGPLAGLIAWGEITSFDLEKDHPVNSGLNNIIDIYYFDGPYFKPYDDSSIEVLARYSINNEPAVVAGRFGKGKYLLLGPHPELGGYSQESHEFNIDGEDGAQWTWLHSVLLWLYLW